VPQWCRNGAAMVPQWCRNGIAAYAKHLRMVPFEQGLLRGD